MEEAEPHQAAHTPANNRHKRRRQPEQPDCDPPNDENNSQAANAPGMSQELLAAPTSKKSRKALDTHASVLDDGAEECDDVSVQQPTQCRSRGSRKHSQLPESDCEQYAPLEAAADEEADLEADMAMEAEFEEMVHTPTWGGSSLFL